MDQRWIDGHFFPFGRVGDKKGVSQRRTVLPKTGSTTDSLCYWRSYYTSRSLHFGQSRHRNRKWMGNTNGNGHRICLSCCCHVGQESTHFIKDILSRLSNCG